VLECPFLRGRSAAYQDARAGGCAGRSAPQTYLAPPPVTYAVPAPSGGCVGTRSVERYRFREVHRERRAARGGGCYGGSVQTFAVPVCPPQTYFAPPAPMPGPGTPDKKDGPVEVALRRE